MATTKINIKGMAELSKLLKELPEKVQRNVVRSALRAGAKPILEEAKANAPVDSGALRDSLEIATSGKGGVPTATVRTKLFYARFIEYGTAPHAIPALSGSALTVDDKLLDHVYHPGAGPRPFMRPAVDTKAEAAVIATGEYIKKRLATKHGLDTADIEIGAEAQE